jgi:hypothetical protein
VRHSCVMPGTGSELIPCQCRASDPLRASVSPSGQWGHRTAPVACGCCKVK